MARGLGSIVCVTLIVACGRSPIAVPSADDGNLDGGADSTTPQDELPPDEPEPPPPPESCGDGEIEAGELCFEPQTRFASRIDPCSIDVGDLDGDGHLDVAVPNSDFDHTESPQNFASILYGDGLGGLSEPYPTLAGGDIPVGIAIGAFDSELADDLLVSNSDTAATHILFGADDRAFDAPHFMAAEEAPAVVATGDLDADGLDDFAVTTSTGIVVWRNLGDRTFGDRAFHTRGTYPWGVAFADVDGDALLDLVVADRGSSSLLPWLGDGTGNLLAADVIEVGSSPSGVTAADVDADGRDDLLSANEGSSTVSVVLGGADGAPPIELATDWGPRAVAASDFDADGHVDLAVLSGGAQTVQFFVGDSTGSFAPAASYAVGNNPSGIRAGDFNEDGIDDVAVSNQNDNDVGLILSNP